MQIDGARHAAAWRGPIHLRVRAPLCLDRDNRDNHEGDWIHDHELVLEEEAQEVTERRLDEHDLLGHQEQAEVPRHVHADCDVEVYVGHAESREEMIVKCHLPDAVAFCVAERDMAMHAGLRESGPSGGPEVLAAQISFMRQILAAQIALVREILATQIAFMRQALGVHSALVAQAAFISRTPSAGR